MNRKAQVIGQVFIFMLALILAATLLLYGYKAIFGQDGFIHRTEQISLVSFQTDISREISSISSDYGTVKEIKLILPSKYKQVCLVDIRESSSGQLCDSGSAEYEPLICNAWDDKSQNVFLIPSADIPIIVSTMEINDGYICVPVRSGTITLWLKGLGDSAGVCDQVSCLP